MIEIVPYRRELLRDFIYNGIEKDFHGGEILPIVEFYTGLGECYVGLVDGKVIGLGGVYPLWENAGSAFLFLNKEAHSHKKSVFKAVLKYMDMLIKKYEIKTFFVECKADSLQANSLITHLGFIHNRLISTAVYTKSL